MHRDELLKNHFSFRFRSVRRVDQKTALEKFRGEGSELSFFSLFQPFSFVGLMPLPGLDLSSWKEF